MTEHDKLMEQKRYDARALKKMFSTELMSAYAIGSNTMPAYLRGPYIYYEQQITELILPSHQVLELGAGEGLHTLSLLQTKAQVIASDISLNCLSMLMQQSKNISCNLKLVVADMESLPFDNSSFDVIVCAGSLSYGEPNLVDKEIRRVLRPGGMLIFVDSLNYSPVYRMNRWLHYLRGNRSRSTLTRMPDLERIRSLEFGFSSVNVRYFGALSYLMPVISRFLGENIAEVASNWFDYWIGVKRSAFKFVLVAKGFTK
jgi:ubiquinone/menaquinone biosynthesis C-methylase UbiE